MARFKPILMEKISRLEQAEQEQRELKQEYGIAADDVVVRKKNIKDYAISILKWIGYFIYIILVFLGIVTLINPISRDIFLGMLGIV